MQKQDTEPKGAVEAAVTGQAVERWDTLELTFQTMEVYKNPFTEVELTARFTHVQSGQVIAVDGFYDGADLWRVRFMPAEEGSWRYETTSTDRALHGHVGELTCVAPEKSHLHGPLRAVGYHFLHADGTRRFLISTRVSCHFLPAEGLRELVAYFKAHRINRVFFMMGGAYGTVRSLYGEDGDFSRYNVDKFQAIDAFINLLREYDIIASPYFYYFNDLVQRNLTPEQDRAYLRYGMARFGAYTNVMPVLSNEVEQKFTGRLEQYVPASWAWANEMGPYLKSKAVFGQPVTIHNPLETMEAINPGFYTLLRDWPFPWADCMLRQAQVGALSAAPELSDDTPEQMEAVYNERGYARHNELFINLRRFGIPMVNEEPGYEMEGRGAIPGESDVNFRPWNSQTSHTLIPTFWTAVCAGSYVMWGHYATYWFNNPLPRVKRSETPGCLKVLHDCVTALPYWEMQPCNAMVSEAAVVIEGKPYRTNFCLAKPGAAYLVFSLHGGAVILDLPAGNFRATQLDPRSGESTESGRLTGGKQKVTLREHQQVLVIRADASE